MQGFRTNCTILCRIIWHCGRQKLSCMGAHSILFQIYKQVFQGTALGPSLWNVLFKSVDAPILEKAFRAAKFADDLSDCKNFVSSTPHTRAHTHTYICKLRDLQCHVHAWGRPKQVTFDPSKQHVCIFLRPHCEGESFKLLGTLIDPKLIVEEKVRRISRKCLFKIKAILATRCVYGVSAMVQHFKSRVWCIFEASNIAACHASVTRLASISALHSRFLKEIGLTDETVIL